jgi:hypothetical protein
MRQPEPPRSLRESVEKWDREKSPPSGFTFHGIPLSFKIILAATSYLYVIGLTHWKFPPEPTVFAWSTWILWLCGTPLVLIGILFRFRWGWWFTIGFALLTLLSGLPEIFRYNTHVANVNNNLNPSASPSDLAIARGFTRIFFAALFGGGSFFELFIAWSVYRRRFYFWR